VANPPSEPPRSEGDRVRERIAAARSEAERGLSAALERFQRDEHSFREETARRAEELAGERARAVVEELWDRELDVRFESLRGELTREAESHVDSIVKKRVKAERGKLGSKLKSDVRERLAAAERRLDERTAERVREVEQGQARLTAEVAKRLKAAEERADARPGPEGRPVKGGRHERRLARNETAQRVEKAIADRTDELERRLDARHAARSAETRLALEEVLRKDARELREAEGRRAGELLDAKAAEADARLESRVKEASEKLGMLNRRQEAKLARQETARRIQHALAKLEQRSVAAGDEMSARLGHHAASLEEGLTRRAGELDGELAQNARSVAGEVAAQLAAPRDRVLDAEREVETLHSDAVARGERTERITAELTERVEAVSSRMARALAEVEAAEARIIASEGRVIRAMQAAHAAANWEQRIRRATSAEEQAAQRIKRAEDSIRAMVDPLGNGN
jgi:hypothetical protein